jgi:hypothetical protein
MTLDTHEFIRRLPKPTPLPAKIGIVPHDDNLRAFAEKPFTCLVAPPQPRHSSLRSCVTTQRPHVTDTRPADSEERVAPHLHRKPAAQPTLPADVSCGPPAAKSP